MPKKNVRLKQLGRKMVDSNDIMHGLGLGAMFGVVLVATNKLGEIVRQIVEWAFGSESKKGKLFDFDWFKKTVLGNAQNKSMYVNFTDGFALFAITIALGLHTQLQTYLITKGIFQ